MSETLTAELVPAESGGTLCSTTFETVAETTLTIPSRWNPGRNLTYAEAVVEVEKHAKLLAEGAKRLCGLYMRICDTMRTHGFTNDEMRKILSKHFPPPRVNEFIRVVNAPDDVYRRYQGKLIGFRAALQQCRGYKINSSAFLKKKKIVRTARVLINLLAKNTPCAFTTGGFKVTIQPANTHETEYAPVLDTSCSQAAVDARQNELQKIVEMRHAGEERESVRQQIRMMRAALNIGPEAMAKKLEISKYDYRAMESRKREIPSEAWDTLRKNFTLLKANMAARAPSN